MTDNLFAIEIGEKYTCLVDAEGNDKNIKVNNAEFIDTAINYFKVENEAIIEDQAKIIRQLLDKTKIKKKDVSVVIPDALSYAQIITTPKLNEKELLSAIRYQADQFIPMSIEDVTLDIEILSEDKLNKRLEILIIAAPKQIVSRVEKTIEAVGLYPACLENELSATVRLFSKYYKNKNGSLILNLGYSSSSIYFFDHTTSLIKMAHTIKVGYDLFLRDVKVNFGLDDNKAIDLLQRVGFNESQDPNVDKIITPIMKEYLEEIKKFLMVVKDQFKTEIDLLYSFNLSPFIADFEKRLQAEIGITAESLNFSHCLAKNQRSQLLDGKIPLFIPAISSAFT